ncbi:MAG TPA: glutathione S-transferase N-terminal domain-containing protein [Polymorphobacter sp.]|nr:glutathione S-transferase N-terminal domain-containing protein [Polymorphobacter sp.]
MIDLYYWPTPNGHKITLFLEEAALPYTIVPVDITKGDQFEASFLERSPNNRMPMIVDHEPTDGGPALSVFESGAILRYLADKTGLFGGTGLRGRVAAEEWLFWQVGGLGPMAGQAGHFIRLDEKMPYAIKRYTDETLRLCGVMDTRLTANAYLAGTDYTIADMASYPWAAAIATAGMTGSFANLTRWIDAIAARPATVAAYARAKDLR